MVQVLRKLPQLLRVESPAPASPGKADRFGDGDASLRVRLIDRTYVRTLGLRVKEILSDQPEGKMDLKGMKLQSTSPASSGFVGFGLISGVIFSV